MPGTPLQTTSLWSSSLSSCHCRVHHCPTKKMIPLKLNLYHVAPGLSIMLQLYCLTQHQRQSLCQLSPKIADYWLLLCPHPVPINQLYLLNTGAFALFLNTCRCVWHCVLCLLHAHHLVCHPGLYFNITFWQNFIYSLLQPPCGHSYLSLFYLLFIISLLDMCILYKLKR